MLRLLSLFSHLVFRTICEIGDSASILLAGKMGSEMLSNLSEVTQLISVKARIRTQTCLTLNPELFPVYFVASWEKEVLRRNGNLAHENPQKEKKEGCFFSLVIATKRVIKEQDFFDG